MEARRFLQSTLFFLISVGGLLLVWEILSKLRIINPTLFSSPSEIFGILYRLFQTKTSTGQSLLLFHVSSSLYRLLIAFVIAVIVGVGFGILMGWNSYVYRFMNPLVTVAMPVPGVAWIPIFVFWLRTFPREIPIIAVGALAAFFPIVHNMAIGVRSVSDKPIWLSRSMGANERTIFLKVFIPYSTPYLFTGIKLALARGWRTIIAIELIAGTLSGFGYMILDAREYGQPYIILGGMMIIACIYFAIEKAIELVERNSIEKWGMVRS